MKRGNSLSNFIRGLFIFFSLLLVSGITGETDAKAETINYVKETVNKDKSLIAGEKLDITMYLSDEYKGEIKNIIVDYRNMSDGGTGLKLEFVEQSDGTLRADKDITMDSIPGHYMVEDVRVVYKDGSVKSFFWAREGIPGIGDVQFNIENHNGDIIVNSAKKNISEARLNDVIKYSIEIDNKKNRNIKEMKLILINPVTNQRESISMLKQSPTYYTAQKLITKQTALGVWNAEDIIVKTDKDEQFHLKTNDYYVKDLTLKDLGVLVTDKRVDVYGPNVKSLKTDKFVYKPGEIAHIVLEANDEDNNGMKNAMLLLEDLYSKKQEKIRLFENSPGKFQFNREILLNDVNTTWIVKSITISDNKNNVTKLNTNDIKKNLKINSLFDVTRDGKAPIKKITVATPVINQKYISNKTTSISGSSKSNGTVYVLANNKVIGKANVSKAKFKVKFKAVAAGKNVSVYTVQNKVKSKYVNFKVVDKIAPKPPVVNKVTTKSIKVTGSGEKYAQVTVYKGKTLIAKSAVNNRGKFALKINKQKKNTVLNVYLTDKSKNKSKAKSIKVS